MVCGMGAAAAMIELNDDDRERACALLARLYTPRNRIRGKGVRIPRTFPKAELAWLEDVGLAPNQRSELDHGKVVRQIRAARKTVSIQDGARAFLASLGRGAPQGMLLEVALLAHRMPSHPFRSSGPTGPCHECFMHASEVVDVAEQFLGWHTQGGGLAGDPKWAPLALRRLAAAPVARLDADAKGRIGVILHTLDNLPDDAPMGGAIQAVRALDVLGPDPKGWRAKSVLETLALAGLLDAPPYHGIADAWLPYIERDRRPNNRVEVEAPLSFWRGRHGVHWGHAKAVLAITRAQAAKAQATRPVAEAPSKAKPRAKAKKSGAPPGVRRQARRPAERGDVWAIRVREDTYVLVYVWEVLEPGRRFVRVEFLDWIGGTPPEAPAVGDLGLRARDQWRWQYKTHDLHSATGTVLVATDVAPTQDPRPEPKRVPGGSAKDLRWLADACFPELGEL